MFVIFWDNPLYVKAQFTEEQSKIQTDIESAGYLDHVHNNYH